MFVRCLFEQSGTFKNEFIALGYTAFDYDIKNDFKQTDYVIDLFEEIDNAFNDKKSIFHEFKHDLVVAFFPCTRFCASAHLFYQGNAKQFLTFSDIGKVNYSLNMHDDLSLFYKRFCQLYLLSFKYDFRLVIENPYHQPHYLTRYFPIKPTLIDYDRRLNGDYYEKPTQYFFVNFTPFNNFVFEPLPELRTKFIETASNSMERSLISPVYANRFIRQFLIPG